MPAVVVGPDRMFSVEAVTYRTGAFEGTDAGTDGPGEEVDGAGAIAGCVRIDSTVGCRDAELLEVFEVGDLKH